MSAPARRRRGAHAGRSAVRAHAATADVRCPTEWNYGGFPAWLRDRPGMEFRTYNAPYLAEMKRWVDYLVAYLRRERVFAPQGGPVILAQIENEYGNVEDGYGVGGKRYVQWCADYVQTLRLGIPVRAAAVVVRSAGSGVVGR